MSQGAAGVVAGPTGGPGVSSGDVGDVVGSVVEEIHRVGGQIRHDIRSGTFSAEDRAALAAILSRLERDIRGTPSPGETADDADTIRVGGDETLDAAWGPAVSPDDAAAAAEDMAAIRFAERRSLADRSLTRAQVAELLSVSAPAITKHLEAGRLLGFKVRGRWAIPRWQFDPDSATGMLPGLGRLLATFPGGLVQLSRWACTPNLDLAGRMPRDVLADGEVDDVVAAAAAMTATGW